MTTENSKATVVVTRSTKSMGIGIILTILFGPLGMFYSTVWGAIIMMILSVIVALLTAGVGLLVMWPIGLIWTIIAIRSYNRKLLSGQV